MKFSAEPYTGPFEGLAVAAKADLPMGEFWAGGDYFPSIKLASSITHINGGNLVGAEAFTAQPNVGRWQNYPAKHKDINLKAMMTMEADLQLPVGYSDHTEGTLVSVAAVAMGARLIEKHFTLDRESSQPAEHHFSLEPKDLKVLVDQIRQIEKALGQERMTVSSDEKALMKQVKRSLHINRILKKGETITEDDISVLRPADGAIPSEIEQFIGKSCSRDMEAWDPLRKEDV